MRSSTYYDKGKLCQKVVCDPATEILIREQYLTDSVTRKSTRKTGEDAVYEEYVHGKMTKQ
jgi:hypothetical protein